MISLRYRFPLGLVLVLVACGGNGGNAPDLGDQTALPPNADQPPVLSGAPPPEDTSTLVPSATGAGDCMSLCAALSARGCETDGDERCAQQCDELISGRCGSEAVKTAQCLVQFVCPQDLEEDAGVAALCPAEYAAFNACGGNVDAGESDEP